MAFKRPGGSVTNVLIADDHAMVRTGLRHYLEQDRAFDNIAETATGSETLDQLRRGHWDLVVLDINMPDRSGLDILRHIKASHPNTRVLVISGFAEKQYGIMVLRSGASGYIAKDQAPEEFLRAVRTVLAGRRFVSAELSDMLVNALDEPGNQPLHSVLSQREFQIMCKLSVGRTVTEIAEELFISVKTVSTYRGRVLQKMNFTTNADLTTYALNHGLV
jgi:two-component system, NarL family, invasion response regulator UvrY